MQRRTERIKRLRLYKITGVLPAVLIIRAYTHGARLNFPSFQRVGMRLSHVHSHQALHHCTNGISICERIHTGMAMYQDQGFSIVDLLNLVLMLEWRQPDDVKCTIWSHVIG